MTGTSMKMRLKLTEEEDDDDDPFELYTECLKTLVVHPNYKTCVTQFNYINLGFHYKLHPQTHTLICPHSAYMLAG